MQGNGGRIGSLNVFVVSLLRCRQLFADMSFAGLLSAYSTSTTQVQYRRSDHKYRRTRRSCASRRQQYKTTSYSVWITHVTIRQPRHTSCLLVPKSSHPQAQTPHHPAINTINRFTSINHTARPAHKAEADI